MLGKRIKPNMQWTDVIYPILLISNRKLAHSSFGLTPNDARKPSNEFDAYIHMNLKSKN